MIFTKRFIWVVGIGVIIVGISYIMNISLWVFLLYNLLSFGVLVLDYFISSDANEIEIERIGDEKLSLYENEKIKFSVYNKGNSSIYVEMKDDVPNFHFQSKNNIMKGLVQPHSKEAFEYIVVPTKRGVFTFEKLHVRIESRFKLCMNEFVVFLKMEYKVYPNMKNLRKYRLASYNNHTLKIGDRRVKLIGSGTEFESLREYVIGDEYRKINWSATAHEEKVIVNQYQPEKNQHVYAFIDTGRPMSYTVRGYSKLDLAINTGLLLCDIANQNGDQSGLMTFNTQVNKLIKPGKGHQHRYSLMEALYHIEHTNETSNYEEAFYYFNKMEKRRSIIVLFTDFNILEEAEEMSKILPVLSRNNLVLIVLIKDERLEKVASIRVDSDSNAMLKGTALEMLSQRKGIIKKLNSKGVMCLECEPERLSVSVINKYIEIKNRIQI